MTRKRIFMIIVLGALAAGSAGVCARQFLSDADLAFILSSDNTIGRSVGILVAMLFMYLIMRIKNKK